MKVVPTRVALPFCLLAAATLGGAALSSRACESDRSQVVAVADGWRTVAAAEHLAVVLRKTEAACAGVMPARAPSAGSPELPLPLQIEKAAERFFTDAAAQPDRLAAWASILSQLQAALAAPGCSAPFGLAASGLEELALFQRTELGHADRRARERGSLATGVLFATDAALLLLVAAAALAVREHLRERQRCEAEQARALELQQQLMGIVGHDLRTPLNAIAGSAALLARAPDLPSSRLRAAQRIVSSAARMSGLIRDLLDFTRLRVGPGFSVTRARTHLGQICRLVSQEVKSAWPGSVIEIEELGELSGDWDPDRIEQVFSNLIGNACHHGASGAPVRVRVVGSGDSVRAEVHNEGPPISAETLPHIFEPFRRGGSDRHDASGGVGLGLFIVRSLVEAHGGTIEVKSGEAGTTFTVVLPRSPPEEGPGVCPEP